MKPRFPLFLLTSFSVLPLAAQSTLDWRSEATNGNWNDLNNWWAGSAVSPPGSEVLRFNNNTQLLMTNDASNTTRHQIIFDTGATSSRTIGGTTVNNFVAVSGTAPLIQNKSGASHTINFPISLGEDALTLDNSTAGNNSSNLNFGGKITGTGNLILKANGDTSDSGGNVGGNLSLLNSTNDFTGNITIQSGVVDFSGDGSFGNTANDIVIQDGGLVATGNRNLPTTRDIVLSGGGNKVFRAYGSATFTINGSITGTGNVRHTDGGALVLNGTNSFTGNIDNVRGDLNLSNSAHTGNVVNSAGTLILNAGNTYTGYTHIQSSSTLRLDADNALPNGTTVLLYGGSTFNANGKTDTLGSLTTGSAADTNVIVNLGTGANLTITSNNLPAGLTSGYGNATVAGKITGTGNITYNHATTNNAQWDWANAANDFTGNVTVTQGRLRVASNATTPTDAALGNAVNDLIFNGEIVSTLGNQQGKASIQVQNGTNLPLGAGRDVILNNGKEGTMYVWGGTTMTINGKVTGGGNLRKEDSGILLLNNTANDYSGLTRIADGTIRVGVTGVIPDASGVEIAGGNLDLNNVGETVASLTGSGGAISGGNTLTVLTSGSASYSGAIGTTTTLHMAGIGTQTIAGTGDNTNGWASVLSGTLVLGKTSSGAVHAVGRSFGVGLTISGGIAKLGGSGDDQIYQQTDVSQSAGVFDLNGNSEGFRGLIGAGGTVRNDAASTNSVLTLGESGIATDSFTYNGAIENGAGTVKLTKTGLGTQTLTGNNTYAGNTTVNAGTLKVSGSISSSEVTVNNAGTVLASGNTGTIGKGVTVNNAAILAAGGKNAIGTATVGSSGLKFDSGSIFEWDLASGVVGTRGTDYDGVNVGGPLSGASGGAAAIFKVVLGSGSYGADFWKSNHDWTGIFTASNTINMSSVFSSIQWWEGSTNVTGDTVTPPGHFSFTNTGSTLTWTAVPEPTSALAGLLIIGGLLRRRRS